jgi:hypothetical protein
MAGRPILKAKLVFHLDITRGTGRKNAPALSQTAQRRSISAASSAAAAAAAGFVDARGERFLALLQFKHALLDPASHDKLVG